MRELAAATLGSLRAYRGAAALIALSQVPAVGFYTLQPLLLRALIDDAITPADGRLAALLIAGMVGLLLLHALGDLTSHYLVARVAVGVVNDLRRRIFAHVQTLSVGFHARSRAGDLLARFSSDLEVIERFLTDNFPQAIYCVLTLVAGAVILLTIEWRLGLGVLVLLPAVQLAPRVVAPRAGAASYGRQDDAGRVLATMHEGLAAHLVVRAFGLGPHMRERLGADLQRLARSTARAGLLNGILAASMTASGYALLALTMGAATALAIHGALSVGSVIAVFELLWFMVAAVQSLSSAVAPLQKAAAGMRRVQDLLDERPEVAQATGARPLPPLTQAIRFEHVEFAHAAGPAVLRDVTVTIRAGRSVAIVGPSGSGKSTLLSLLMRFHDPTAGTVTIDGHDLRHVTLESLTTQTGVVFQESFLFDGTIRENIRLGRPPASDAEVEAAARDAGLHDAVLALPMGYDTPVGERGGRLSGGERQRLALARALLRRPALLLLDEATSSLDAETEAAVNATIERLREGRTVVSVTHRLAAAVGADQILVLERGRLVEVGVHDELLDRKGAYFRAWRRQQGFVVSANGRRATIEPDRLRGIPLFEPLRDAQLTEVARRFVARTCLEGEVLVHEGDPGDTLYVIVRGRVDVTQRAADGSARSLGVLEDGDFFGEIALLEAGRRTATVRARTPGLLLTLDRDQFHELKRAVPGLTDAVARVGHARRQSDRDG